MGQASKIRPPTVRRITIDEKLTPSLIRILVAKLKPGLKEFDDDPKYWNAEKDILVQPDSFQKTMGMTLSNAEKWPWNKHYEGQTFLQGYFTLKPGAPGGPRFLVNGARQNFRCINDMIKNPIKQLYFSAIKGGSNNG